MPDRITLVRVEHQLGPSGGAGGEVEQQRIGGAGLAVGREDGGLRVRILVALPSRPIGAGGGPSVPAGQVVELGGAFGIGHHVADLAALQPVGQVGTAQLRGAGHHHDAELHGRQQRLPQRGDVGQHEQQPVAPASAERAKAIGHPVAALGELGERAPHLGPVLANQPERQALVALRRCTRGPRRTARAGVDVEPVQGPIEPVERGPAKLVRRVVPLAASEQELAGVEEGVCHSGSGGRGAGSQYGSAFRKPPRSPGSPQASISGDLQCPRAPLATLLLLPSQGLVTWATPLGIV